MIKWSKFTSANVVEDNLANFLNVYNSFNKIYEVKENGK